MTISWQSMRSVGSSTIQAFQVMIPYFSDCHHHKWSPQRHHHWHHNTVRLFVTLPLNQTNCRYSRAWLHLSTAIMIPIQMKTMYRHQQRPHHQFQLVKQHQSRTMHSVITVSDIYHPSGHRRTKVQLSTATKIAFYRLHAMPIGNWPLPNILNRVAVGISNPFTFPDHHPSIRSSSFCTQTTDTCFFMSSALTQRCNTDPLRFISIRSSFALVDHQFHTRKFFLINAAIQTVAR